MIHPRCCGTPGCSYWERQPMARRPAPRWVDTGSRLLAVLAFVLLVVTAGSTAFR